MDFTFAGFQILNIVLLVAFIVVIVVVVKKVIDTNSRIAKVEKMTQEILDHLKK